MNILLIGSGGREHALAWKIAQSPLLTKLYAIPGSDAIAQFAICKNINPTDNEAIIKFSQANNIDLIVIGSEAPLVGGLTDAAEKANILAFGPSKAAAELEGSKGFMRDFTSKYNIPGAKYKRCNDFDSALAYINSQPTPIVIKLDGLAAGKGVVIAYNKDEAVQCLNDIFSSNPKQAIVIEEYLEGEEASFFCLCDGNNAISFGTAQDHKRLYDGDKGPNTGGMGSYAPAPIISQTLEHEIMQSIVLPTIKGMASLNMPYKGILYVGLMITQDGPKLIEYNVRFGDPECQVLMRNLKDDLLPWLIASAKGTLPVDIKPQWLDQSCICVVMASRGYPSQPEIGDVITGLTEAEKDETIVVYHAATKQNTVEQLNNSSNFYTAGGRVLNITATARDLATAQKTAYQAVNKIKWDGVMWRKDIGHRALNK